MLKLFGREGVQSADLCVQSKRMVYASSSVVVKESETPADRPCLSQQDVSCWIQPTQADKGDPTADLGAQRILYYIFPVLYYVILNYITPYHNYI